MAPGGTSHINVKVEDTVMHDAGSRKPSAKVGISSAESDITVLKEVTTKYCQILDVRFQDLLENL